jgi:DNA-binding NtrC family response regulator
MTLADVERRHVARTLEHTGYNQSAAARLLDVDRHALLRKMKKLGLDMHLSQRGRPPTSRGLGELSRDEPTAVRT